MTQHTELADTHEQKVIVTGYNMENRLQKLYANKKYFEILEIEPTMDRHAISKACRMLALKYHPDKGGSHEEMVIVVDIMQKLNDEHYLKPYFQHVVFGDAFNEDHFQFESTFRTADNPENLQKYMDHFIHSIDTNYNNLIAMLEREIAELMQDPCARLRESIENPFEVNFSYKHKGYSGEIEIEIQEELDNDEYWGQRFQHTITDGAFIDKVEWTYSFLASPENVQEKVGRIIQKINKQTISHHTIDGQLINGDNIKRSNKELFDKLNHWLEQQMAEYREIAPTRKEQNYGDNTRRGKTQKWLNQIEQQRIKQNPVGNIGRIATGAMLYFFPPASPAPAPSLPQPNSYDDHFEVDYWMLSLLAVASLTIIAAFLFCISRSGKARDLDDSIDRGAMQKSPG